MFQRIIFCCRAFFSLFGTMMQLLYGMWRIGGIKTPMVSIFGGAQLKQTDYYARKAHELSQRIVDANISVLTGGGPGIMEAANCGAIYAKRGAGRSIGIGVRDLNEPENICVQEFMRLNHFWARKWLLTHYSLAFIVFPGGFGTLDELSEVLTLMQTNKATRVPIILVGVEYWKSFMEWASEALHHGTIRKEEMELFMVTDNLDEVFKLVVNACTPPTQ